MKPQRTATEIFALVLDVAQKNVRIRAVTLEGSRINPNAPKDIFQDYDISYFVTDMTAFIDDDTWINIFGSRLILQKPEAMELFPPSLGNRFSYLMLFTDGSRIDLTLIPINEIIAYCTQNDTLMQVLLDKDNAFPQISPCSDAQYHVQRPTAGCYADCCNEFWWVATYIAKGLWRQELLYALDHLNNNVRPCLLQMLAWKVGLATDFSVSVGKNYKYLQQYINQQEWQVLCKTYALDSPEQDSYATGWQALFSTLQLFRETALFVGQALQYPYPAHGDTNITQYLTHVYNLPPKQLSFKKT